MVQWEAFKEDFPSRLMRLIETKTLPPCVVVFPDLYTDFGGSQFIDSSCFGSHASHIVLELIPYVEQKLPVLPGVRHRGVFGRSSGGFGALRLAMDFPGSFAAVACHAGDMGFDWVYRRCLIDLCTALAKFQSAEKYLDFTLQQKKISGWDTHILMLLGMCGFYSPNIKCPLGFDLPIDINSGKINEEVYALWNNHDPLTKIEERKTQDALHNLSCLFLDCGTKDQYFLQYGSRQFVEALKKHSLKYEYQEFDDNHSGTNYRFDVSLPKMLSALI
jgi:S-formylglutathione hydrolase FrmB